MYSLKPPSAISIVIERIKGSGTARSVLKGSVSAMGVKVVGMACGFLLSLLLTRLLGVDGFGAYSLALSWVLLFSVPVQAGLVGVMVREVAAYRATGAWAVAKGLLMFSNLFCVALAIASALLFWGYWSYSGPAGSGLSLDQVAWIVILVPVYCLSSLRSAVLRGFGKVVQGLAPEQVVRPLAQAAIVLLIWVAGTTIGPTGALSTHLVAAVVAFAVGAVFLYRSLPGELRGVAPEFRVAAWLKPVLAFSLVSGFGSIAQSLVMIILGDIGSNEDVGLFKAAQQVASLSGIVILAVNSAAAPHISSLFRLRRLGELERLLRRFSWVMIAGTLPLSVVLVVWSQEILQLLFGVAYGQGSLALGILAMGQLMVSTCGLVGLTMNMSGFERDTLVCCIVALTVTIVASVPLAATEGAAGVAGAVVLGQIVMQSLLLWRVRVRVGVSTSILFHGKGGA